MLKIDVFAPIPNASVRMMMRVKPGLFRMMRKAYLISFNSISMIPPMNGVLARRLNSGKWTRGHRHTSSTKCRDVRHLDFQRMVTPGCCCGNGRRCCRSLRSWRCSYSRNICREEPVFTGKVTCGVRNETSGQSWPSNTVATDRLTGLSSKVVHPVSCRLENSTFDLVYKASNCGVHMYRHSGCMA
jgi:hypothetical protein